MWPYTEMLAKMRSTFITASNAWRVSLVGGDIQIGAVEIKDGTTDQRAVVTAAGALRVAQPTHDDLGCNANLQVGDVDVAVGNPVPVDQITPAYLGSPERLTMNAGSVAATLPANTNRLVLAAEGGDVRYAINAVATATSPGYVPAGSIVVIRASNLTSFACYGAVGAFANLVYYQE